VELDVDSARTATRTGRHADRSVSPYGRAVKREAGAGREKALFCHPEGASVASVSAARTRSSRSVSRHDSDTLLDAARRAATTKKQAGHHRALTGRRSMRRVSVITRTRS
jgi:hypothetical protein